jgi:hypothetical protein
MAQKLAGEQNYFLYSGKEMGSFQIFKFQATYRLEELL